MTHYQTATVHVWRDRPTLANGATLIAGDRILRRLPRRTAYLTIAADIRPWETLTDALTYLLTVYGDVQCEPTVVQVYYSRDGAGVISAPTAVVKAPPKASFHPLRGSLATPAGYLRGL